VSTYADVALRAPSGKTVATQRVQFTPHSQQQLSVRALRQTGSEPNLTTGSIVVSQSPSASGMTVLGAIAITQLSPGTTHYVDQILAKPSYVDQELAMPSEDSSPMLRAVADSSDGSPLVAVTSLSTMPQHVAIACVTSGQNQSSKITLAPGQSVLLPPCDPEVAGGADLHWYAENLPHTPYPAAGIELTSDGKPGSFAAFGLAPHDSAEGRYFSSVAFTDPKMLMSSTAVYAGVPVGSSALLPAGIFTPVLSLVNFSKGARQVSVKYALTRDGAASLNTIASITLAPLSSREIALSGLGGDPTMQDSFLVESDGSPGDVGTKLVSKSGGALHEVELLAKDFEDPENGGDHPWTVENGTTSTLVLFNESGKPQWFNVQIAASATVWSNSYELQPYQTEAIGINDLIKTAAKDKHGTPFPSDVWSGQVSWSVPHKNAGRGRLLQSNPETAMARSFSCGYNIELCQATLDDVEDYAPVGQTVDFGTINTEVCVNSCSGAPVGSGGAGYFYGWSSQNSNIAPISGSASSQSANVYGASVGSTYIDSWAADDYCLVRIPSAPVNVCGVAVPQPYSVTAQSCQGEQSQRAISAQIVPSGSQCPWSLSQSSCIAGNAQGQVDLDGASLNASAPYNGGTSSTAQCLVNFFAGPTGPPWPRSGSNAGSFVTAFSISIGGTTYPAQGTINVYCP